MADQTQRLEIATVKAEVGSNILFRFANDAANAGTIPTDSGSIPNLKQVVVDIQSDAADKISIATTIYQSPAAGLAATADGGIFLVQSPDADTIYTVWKNQAGAAVNTGKTAMSSQAIQDALTASNEAAQAAEDAADVATNRTAGFVQPSATAPVVRDNGLALQVGDRYFNTAQQTEYLYTTAGWVLNDAIAAVDQLDQRLDNLEDVVSVTAEAGGIPRADELGNVSDQWLSPNVVRLDTDIEGSTVEALLKNAKTVSDYPALLAYSGSATVVRITKRGLEGFFEKVETSVPSDGGTKMGFWRRVYDGAIKASWFGASTDSANCTPAILAAIAAAQANGGGEVEMPFGKLKCSTTCAINPIAGGWHNLVLRGQGQEGTLLDFATAATGADGMTIQGYGGRIKLDGFSIVNAKGVGLNVNPVNRGSSSFVSRVSLSNMRVDNSVLDGFRFTQVYMADLFDIEATNNQNYGLNFRGSHTSINATRVWAGGDAARPNGGNLSGGWMINGCVYCNFTGGSADNNGGPGVTVKATGGVGLYEYGSEANFGAGFLVISDNQNIDNIPTPGVFGLIMDGCFAINNGAASAATPNFLELRSADGRLANVLLRGCRDLDGPVGSDVSIAMVGAGGQVTLEEQGCQFFGTRTKSGNTYVKNTSVAGRACIAKLAADQSIPDSTSTLVGFSTFDSNFNGATIVTNGKVVIPAGVNRVKVCAGIFWASNSVGYRTVSILKNDLSVYGLPSQKTAGNANTQQEVSSAIIEVVAGDTISVTVVQTGGAALNIVANPNTFLSIEAIG